MHLGRLRGAFKPVVLMASLLPHVAPPPFLVACRNKCRAYCPTNVPRMRCSACQLGTSARHVSPSRHALPCRSTRACSSPACSRAPAAAPGWRACCRCRPLAAATLAAASCRRRRSRSSCTLRRLCSSRMGQRTATTIRVPSRRLGEHAPGHMLSAASGQLRVYVCACGTGGRVQPLPAAPPSPASCLGAPARLAWPVQPPMRLAARSRSLQGEVALAKQSRLCAAPPPPQRPRLKYPPLACASGSSGPRPCTVASWSLWRRLAASTVPCQRPS